MNSQDPSSAARPPLRLVSSRADFLVIYSASLGGMIAVFLMTYFVQRSAAPLSEYALALPIACTVALVPPALGSLIPASRVLVQVLFGLAFVPVVGAIVVNAMAFVRAL